MTTGDVKEKDHRIRLTGQELTWITEALDHMVKEHTYDAVKEGSISWADYLIHNLRDRLNPRRLGRIRRW